MRRREFPSAGVRALVIAAIVASAACGSSPTPKVPRGGPGLLVGRDAGAWRVRAVGPATSAERAGVRDGDGLLAIDGVPTAGLDAIAVERALHGEPGTRVRLTLRRGAETIDVEIDRAVSK